MVSVQFLLGQIFTKSPNSHFAVGIRGSNDAVDAIGRGITIGFTHLNTPPISDPNKGGCQDFLSIPDGLRPAQSQIESFWAGGNYTYADTCRPIAGYEDSKWYTVTIHANDTGWVAFWIDDARGNRIDAGFEPAKWDGNNPVPSGLTGIWIALAHGPGDLTDYWQVAFQDMTYVWF